MLEKLVIKNIALIEKAEINFNGGLNVLSGETGSGKSIILDSLNFALGSKADKTMIRYGAEEAVVSAEFSVSENSGANKILAEFDIDPEDTIIISRKFTAEGKSSIKINGNAVTATMLKKVASHLVDVHGQSEHFFLLSEANQLNVVDSLCGDSLERKKGELNLLLQEKKDLKRRISELGGSEQERAQILDLLSYQISEIESVDIKIGELGELKAKKKLFDNYEKIYGAIGAIDEILSRENGCNDQISLALRQAAQISTLGEEYKNLYSRLENLSVEADDIRETVSDLLDGFGFDEEEAQAVDRRLDLIKSLTRKYGGDEQEILSFLQNARNRYDALSDASAETEKLLKKIGETDKRIYAICKSLTDLRRAACEKFCSGVESQLKTLNIPNAKFFVEFEPYDESCLGSVTSSGADKICFMFSANKGEPAKPLNKVISGGEMSRFMLAVKTQLKDVNGISTYVFDEIDAGISGATAKSVAEKFILISKETQIIAVSHLPQVCAAASAQFLISKHDTADSKTVTQIKRLNRSERIEELIRLTGGESTQAAKMHADELLTRYGN